jgi:hypothetical protein
VDFKHEIPLARIFVSIHTKNSVYLFAFLIRIQTRNSLFLFTNTSAGIQFVLKRLLGRKGDRNYCLKLLHDELLKNFSCVIIIHTPCVLYSQDQSCLTPIDKGQ